jgi:hypothetical protein
VLLNRRSVPCKKLNFRFEAIVRMDGATSTPQIQGEEGLVIGDPLGNFFSWSSIVGCLACLQNADAPQWDVRQRNSLCHWPQLQAIFGPPKGVRAFKSNSWSLHGIVQSKWRVVRWLDLNTSAGDECEWLS